MVVNTPQTEEEEQLTLELEALNKEVDGREQLFYDVVKDRYGAVPSEGGKYIVTLNEFSVYFPATVANPHYKEDSIELGE